MGTHQVEVTVSKTTYLTVLVSVEADSRSAAEASGRAIVRRAMDGGTAAHGLFVLHEKAPRFQLHEAVVRAVDA